MALSAVAYFLLVVLGFAFDSVVDVVEDVAVVDVAVVGVAVVDAAVAEDVLALEL